MVEKKIMLSIKKGTWSHIIVDPSIPLFSQYLSGGRGVGCVCVGWGGDGGSVRVT